MARLEVEDLSFAYPGAQAATLDGINFCVPAGGSLALLGSSGAGKTTLLNLLSGLLPCDRGRILFDGVDVASLGAADRGVAQVFQFPVMYESLSVRDNIAFPLRARGFDKHEQKSKANTLAELFDLTAILDCKPQALSLFQKQLVGFAKALVRDELPIVLLDEPLTAVEPAMKWRLRRAVKRAQQELNATMVYVTHDQTEALTFADEVSVLHGGKLLQTGTPQQLYEEPAHVEVARFIGNPGMNLLSVEVSGGRLYLAGEEAQGRIGGLPEGSLHIGFRPEWARVVESGENARIASVPGSQQTTSSLSLPARLVGTRLTGSDVGEALGVARLVVGETSVQVASALGGHLRKYHALGHKPDEHEETELQIEIERYELFSNNQRWVNPANDGSIGLAQPHE